MTVTRFSIKRGGGDIHGIVVSSDSAAHRHARAAQDHRSDASVAQWKQDSDNLMFAGLPLPAREGEKR